MSPQQTAVYLTRIRDRIAAIRENTNTNATSLKTRITNTVRRDSLGRRGEFARQALVASLGEYHKGSQKSEDDLRDLSPVEGHRHGWDEDDEEQDWEVRSDSMEPLRNGEEEEIVDRDGEYDEERENWELDMDREHERCMEVDRSMSLESLIAEERFLNGEVESEVHVAYHSMNSRAMRKMRLHEVERMYQSGGRYSTVGKKKGREIQDMLQKYSEEVPSPRRQKDEDELVSNPYPEHDDLIPLTRQSSHGLLPTPNNPRKANTNPSSELSILTNPYPEDAPTTQPPTPPPTQSPYSINRSSIPSHFPIYPSDRTISPTIPFSASRHVLSPISASPTRSHAPFSSESRANAYNNHVKERNYASSHPYHGMNQQETQEYWHDLQGYNTESERHLRRGEDYVRRVGEETQDEQREQAGAKKVNIVGRFLSSFTCRPGAVSPDDAAVPVKNDGDAGMVSIVPRKYAVAFLSRKTGRMQRKEEDGRLGERLLGLQLSPPNEKTRRRIENTRRAIEHAQQVPRAKKRDEGTRRRSKRRVVDVGSQIQGIIGPPVHLSKMIQRAPESIRTPSPLPESGAEPPRIGKNVERVPRQANSDSSSSLSDRLRQTKLEDLPLRTGAAEEIRNLMLDLERDQNRLNTTPPTQRRVGRQPATDPNTPPAEQANKLPGGFSRPENSTTLPKSNTYPSPRESLQRHFNTQREANKQYALRVRAAKSHSSNFTLPPSFRAPEMHSSVLSIPREPSPLAQTTSAEEVWGMDLGQEDGGVVDDVVSMDRSAEGQYADNEGSEEFSTYDIGVGVDGSEGVTREIA